MTDKLESILKNTRLTREERYRKLYQLWESDPKGTARNPGFKRIMDDDPNFKDYLGNHLSKGSQRETQRLRKAPIPPWVNLLFYGSLIFMISYILWSQELYLGISLAMFGGSSLWMQVTGNTNYRFVAKLSFFPLIFFIAGIWIIISQVFLG